MWPRLQGESVPCWIYDLPSGLRSSRRLDFSSFIEYMFLICLLRGESSNHYIQWLINLAEEFNEWLHTRRLVLYHNELDNKLDLRTQQTPLRLWVWIGFPHWLRTFPDDTLTLTYLIPISDVGQMEEENKADTIIPALREFAPRSISHGTKQQQSQPWLRGRILTGAAHSTQPLHFDFMWPHAAALTHVWPPYWWGNWGLLSQMTLLKVTETESRVARISNRPWFQGLWYEETTMPRESSPLYRMRSHVQP